MAENEDFARLAPFRAELAALLAPHPEKNMADETVTLQVQVDGIATALEPGKQYVLLFDSTQCTTAAMSQIQQAFKGRGLTVMCIGARPPIRDALMFAEVRAFPGSEPA